MKNGPVPNSRMIPLPVDSEKEHLIQCQVPDSSCTSNKARIRSLFDVVSPLGYGGRFTRYECVKCGGVFSIRQ